MGSFCHFYVEPQDSHTQRCSHAGFPALLGRRLGLIYRTAAASSPSSLGLPLWALHAGFDPMEAQSWCNLGYLNPKWECGLPTLRGNILAQGSRPKGCTAGNGALRTVSVFQQHMTKGRQREFSDKEISCSLRAQTPLSLWGWWGFCYYLGPVQFLHVARLHFSK